MTDSNSMPWYKRLRWRLIGVQVLAVGVSEVLGWVVWEQSACGRGDETDTQLISH